MMTLPEELECFPQYKEKLFIRSYILTSGKLPSIDSYPFYSNFDEVILNEFTLRVHKKMHLSYLKINEKSYLILIGNCVNPFDLVYDENIIIEKIATKINIDEDNPLEKSIDYINEFTGIFVLILLIDGKLIILSDPAGMLYGCYGWEEYLIRCYMLD